VGAGYRPSVRDQLRVRMRRVLLERFRSLIAPDRLRLLDLGGGTGATTVVFGAGARELVVLEPDERRIVRGQAAHTPVTFVPGVAEQLPFADGRFDRVVSLMSFHHFSNGEKACHEAARVLAPGGRLIIYDLDRGPPPARLMAFWVVRVRHSKMRLLTTAELEQVVRGAGFQNVRCEAFGGGAFVVGER
jgi:ubiquinone/menaquinone biosynthesis C-methylase UbiE